MKTISFRVSDEVYEQVKDNSVYLTTNFEVRWMSTYSPVPAPKSGYVRWRAS